MFEEYLVESRRSRFSKKPATVVLSVAVHSCVVGALIVVPLFQLQVLPQIKTDPPLPPFRISRALVRMVTTYRPGSSGSHASSFTRSLTAPPAIPTTIEFTPVGQPDIKSTLDFESSSGARSGGSSIFGLPVGDPGGPILPPPEKPLPPPLPPAPPPPVQPVYKGPQRVGGDVQQANLLEHPNPVYPRLAALARVQGVVVLEAVITREGSVDSVRALLGHPLLVQAAIDAVRQWRYRPTLLNGQPVDVITTVTVNFTLQ